jgi:hypothetical protein
VGGADAGTNGFFAAPVTWPIIPIHAVLLPDGRVFNYGTNEQGDQGAQLLYDIWDPSFGTGSNSHWVLANTTATDIFCSAPSLLGGNFDTNYNDAGNVLVVGGDLTINGTRNFSNGNAEILSTSTGQLLANGTMHIPRWYTSIVPMPKGTKLILGGRTYPGVPAPYAELYHPILNSFVTMGNIPTPSDDWLYPRAFVGADGAVYEINQNSGRIYRITTDGDGTFVDTGVRASDGMGTYPTVMYQPGKLLSVRSSGIMNLIDINGPNPVVTQGANLSQDRIWANGTVLADGKVLITGGSAKINALVAVAYRAETWDPASGNWTLGAAATKPRLYHSTALLLLDGSVLTGGGGAPGPVKELNAEIYYPPYLYLRDGSGNPAPRPVITSVTPEVVASGNYMNIVMGSSDPVTRVTFVRFGAITHSNNLEQRFRDLHFTQTGNAISAKVPASPANYPPGYYMVFVFNQLGVPSVAEVVSVPRAEQ